MSETPPIPIQIRRKQPSTPKTPEFRGGMDFLVTCSVCATTRLVTADQVRRLHGLGDCPTCQDDNEAA